MNRGLKGKVKAELRRLGVLPPPPPGPPPPPRPHPRWKRAGKIGALLLAVAAILLAIEIRGPQDPDGDAIASDGTESPPAGESVYAQRRVAVHRTAAGTSAVVRTLRPGERIEIARIPRSAWARIVGVADPEYVLRSRRNLLPVQPTLPPPRDTTAICADSTPNFSSHGSGTCSGRGGVLCWIHHPRPVPTHLDRPYCRYLLSQEQR